MKMIFSGKKSIVVILIAVMSGLLAVSCKDDYFYDDKEPNFLGASIYDYMQQDGHYNYFLRLVNDLNYKDVLSYTGSKTLLAARDDAFDRFFASNSYGVKSYDQLSAAQKRSIMNASMINMAYLSSMISNLPSSQTTSGEGWAIRRNTANTYLDSIGFAKDEELFANPYWGRFSNKGLYLVDNEAAPPIVHFTPENLATQGITATDFSIIYNGKSFGSNTFYVNGIKVLEKDIICKNGYVHVLEDVLLPAKNMAQIIRDNGQTKLFSKLMNKFCLPYYSNDISKAAHDFYDGSTAARKLIPASDSVFVKRYFTPSFSQDPNGKTLQNYGLLYYDPTDNGYTSSNLLQDMGAMFVPTDEAMQNYINGSKGRYLKDAYGSWENIPTSILALFIKNHQKKSFINSLPHTWPTMADETSNYMKVSASDISKAYVGNNGAVYISSAVYPPVDYQCVYASALTSNQTRIMNWGIQDVSLKFYLYLRSLENMYNLIVPVDAAFDNYRDPIAWAKGGASREIWSFKYQESNNTVLADVYSVDAGGNKAAKIRQITDQSLIRNRLNDIIDMHIVVGEKEGNVLSGYIDDGSSQYAQTKGGTTIKVIGSGQSMTLKGGGDIEQGSAAAGITENASGQKSIYDSDNGRTFFVDKVLQDPVKSVYTALGEHPEYKAFLDLLKGDDRVFTYFQNDVDVVPVFNLKKLSGSSGLGYVVNSFNNFRYTVFVPTQAALSEAFASDSKLYTWDQIASESDYNLKKQKTLYLLKFLKYHFMDNSVTISGKSIGNLTYETAARQDNGKFYKLVVAGSGSNLDVTSELSGVKASVVKTEGLYNLLTRDYIVDNSDYTKATKIVSSSRAVIHLINKALKFE